MTYVVLVTLLILIQYNLFSFQAGMARGKGDVKAPATSGDEYFERCLRVQLNTLEQLIVTLPAMWIVATFFRPDVAAILGAVFIVGRFLYSAAYRKDPASRTVGFLTSWFANVALILCGLYAVIVRLL